MGSSKRLTVIVAAICALLVLIAPGTAQATDPDSTVKAGLEGCRLPDGATLPASLLCADDQYTHGNLGKSWNELDLVPYRLTTKTGNAQTYSIAIAADNLDGGRPGYDVIADPSINAAQSDASCAITAGAQTAAAISAGVDLSIYRMLTITQGADTTCVFDWVERLALGSHLWPGSSLHSNLLNEDLSTSGIGSREVSIPVNEILPQELSKDMTASQNADHVWTVTKSAQPASLSFGDTCRPQAPSSLELSVTLTWTKSDAQLGVITIITHVYATNPAHRAVNVSASDEIRSGTTVIDTATGGVVSVPANSTQLVLTHTTTAAATATDLNDVAAATYTDAVLGVPIPGNTTATASASPKVTVINDSAMITDSESITGAGLTFAVAAPSVGSFTGGYVAGTATTGPVGWTSGTLTAGGSVTFNKTVYLTPPAITSGTLSDTASLTGSDGFTATGSASVGISATATVKLTINKTIPNVLQTGESQTFTFAITGPGFYSGSASIAFNAGETSKSATIEGLAPGSYTISENAAAHWAPQPPQTVAIDLPSCSGSASFSNNFGPATAQAAKITIPAGKESGWDITLSGTTVGGAAVSITLPTGPTGAVSFGPLDEGTYTMAETPRSDFDAMGTSGECSFTVNYPADADHVFSCTFTNREKGHARVIKTVSGAAPTGTQSFTFQLRQGASAGNSGTTLESLTASSANGGILNFATLLTPGVTYQLCEIAPGWITTLGSVTTGGFIAPDGDGAIGCGSFTVAAGETTIFAINNTPGGRPLTIGFWKNWSSCASSNGKQKPILDNTLYDAAQSGSTIMIGNLALQAGGDRDAATDCAKAVAILNKSSVSGEKMSGDTAYNLAAQLLAAKLNLQTGATTCGGVVTTSVAQAQALLVSINFTGSGPSSMTGAQAAQAKALAATLDRYNNGLLC